MTTPPQAASSGFHLAQLVLDCQTLGRVDFRERHGEAFLLHHGALSQLAQPGDGPQETLVLDLEGKPEDAPPPQLDYLVFPIRRKERSTIMNFISVGRTENNDLVIPDLSLSIFHAFMTRKLDGVYSIQDGRSRNGTFVNEVPVPAQGQGASVDLYPGVSVRFGGVRMSFMLADDLQDLVRILTER